MENLFLNKYFHHLNRKYFPKLFRIEDLPAESQDYVEYLQSSPNKLIKKNKKSKLDSFLFGKTGRVNPEVYQSLSKMKHKDSSQ